MEEYFAKLSLQDKHEATSGEAQESSGEASAQPLKNFIKVMSWNVMGDEKDDAYQATRMTGVVQVINKEQPDVVFLQSVSHENCNFFIDKHSRKYSYVKQVDNHDVDKCRLHLLRKSSVSKMSNDKQKMPSSVGNLYAVKIKADIKGIPMVFIAVHNKSGKPNRDIRLEQHGNMFELMKEEQKEAKEGLTIVAGGTTNSRDYEFKYTTYTPVGIYDLWLSAGSPPPEEFTWDMSVNNNRVADPGIRLNAYRFERLFIKHPSSGSKVKVTNFKLVGRQKMACGKFPSDHFGIMATLQQVD